MKLKANVSILAIIFVIWLTGCGGSGSSTTPPPVESIAATGGTPQSTAVGTAFATPLSATVTSNGSPVSGVAVTFTAPTSGASGTFATGTNPATTNASGVASATFTANTTVGGPYTVTASVAGVSTPASFSLTNTAVSSNNYAFYLSGLEAINGGPNYYALAGSATIDANGNVLGGEQDYNDANGLTDLADQITGGSLSVSGTTGQGTLALITSNAALGVSGIETLGVQFVNVNHALVVQFDGSATSSGSLDLQTLPNSLSMGNGGYAFTLSGVGPDGGAIAIGGVLSIAGAAVQGVFDINDSVASAPVSGTTFSGGTILPADNFGRGTITNTGLLNSLNGSPAITLAYYIVGPGAIRTIDVDTTDSGIGSAFGQGSGSFSNASLPTNSVFGIESNSSLEPLYAAAGMFTAVPDNGSTVTGTFTGVADDDEEGTVAGGAAISGAYSIASNGYGNLTITYGDLGDVSALGIYMTDPNLNLSDPNNSTSGLGGALMTDLDNVLVGTGVLIPQTDNTSAKFTGSYAFGVQDYNGMNEATGWEFDFVGGGSVTGLALDGTGLVSDPFDAFSVTPSSGTDSGVGFSGTAVADTNNPGRYTLPLAVSVGTDSDNGWPATWSVVIYQASGGQLFWMEEDSESLFLGTLQQQGSLTGLPSAKAAAAKSAAAKAKPKQK